MFDKITVVDVLCEFIEIVIHSVLHSRKLYPESIFSTVKKYGTPVYQSIQPDLNEYINNCLKAISFHAKKRQLKRLFICFHTPDKTFEKYIFDVLDLKDNIERDQLLISLEQSLRDFILKLNSSHSYLDDLPEDCTFSIRIETTLYSCLDFNQDPIYESCPWIEVNEAEDNFCSIDIVPLYTLETNFLILQIYTEKTTEGMADTRNTKRKSRLAVFEHVVERESNTKKKRFLTNRLDLDDSSHSYSELVIDEKKPVKKKRYPLIRLTDEPLHLQCKWGICGDVFNLWSEFNTHLIDHVAKESDLSTCQWSCCDVQLPAVKLLVQHISYHGYLSRLKNIGENVLGRNNLPKCMYQEKCHIPLYENGYTCQWEYCSFNFNNIHDFYIHMEIHIKSNPRISNKNEDIICCWKGCNIKFSSQYKLAEHLHTHTKEKTIGCPTCCTLFANKTKFIDHRKRQLATQLQSYQCSKCLKLFPSERLLREHIRSHINHYKCTMCDMTCTKPSALAKHIRFVHIEERLYKCIKCEKTFIEKHNLQLHLTTHNDEKLMRCDLCDFRCRSKVGLENHFSKKHDKPRNVYECHCCKKKFHRGGHLTNHLMKVHNYHWPSGHSRFSYRKDQHGIHRLQTVRYESLEVTQEMIRSESMQYYNENPVVKLHQDGQPQYVLSWPEINHKAPDTAENENSILITIVDVDEHGNIIKSQVFKLKEVRVQPEDHAIINNSIVRLAISNEQQNKNMSQLLETQSKIEYDEASIQQDIKPEKRFEPDDKEILKFKIFKDGA